MSIQPLPCVSEHSSIRSSYQRKGSYMSNYLRQQEKPGINPIQNAKPNLSRVPEWNARKIIYKDVPLLLTSETMLRREEEEREVVHLGRNYENDRSEWNYQSGRQQTSDTSDNNFYSAYTSANYILNPRRSTSQFHRSRVSSSNQSNEHFTTPPKTWNQDAQQALPPISPPIAPPRTKLMSRSPSNVTTRLPRLVSAGSSHSQGSDSGQQRLPQPLILQRRQLVEETNIPLYFQSSEIRSNPSSGDSRSRLDNDQPQLLYNSQSRTTSWSSYQPAQPMEEPVRPPRHYLTHSQQSQDPPLLQVTRTPDLRRTSDSVTNKTSSREDSQSIFLSKEDGKSSFQERFARQIASGGARLPAIGYSVLTQADTRVAGSKPKPAAHEPVRADRREYTGEYTPYTAESYRKEMEKAKVKVGGLGKEERTDDEWKSKLNRLKRQKQYAASLPSPKIKENKTNAPIVDDLPSRRIAAEKREKMMQYANTVPKPAIRPESRENEDTLNSNQVDNASMIMQAESNEIATLADLHARQREQVAQIRRNLRL